MSIRSFSQLRQVARQRLDAAPQCRKIILIYAGIILGLSTISTVIDLLLYLRINQSTGLGNLGIRANLTSLQYMLPLAQTLVTMCLGLGYMAAMLRVARGQYVSPNTLRLGFARFWVLLRMNLLRGLILVGTGIAATYAAAMLFALSPLSRPLAELLVPLVDNTSVLNPGLVLDDALYAQAMKAMVPALWMCLGATILAVTPVAFRYRMADYILIDKPATSALAALKESRLIMRHNRLRLFLVDLKQWPYYLALTAASAVGYADTIAALLGHPIPLPGEATALLVTLAYLVAMFLVYYLMRNQVETVYCLVYEDLRPREESSGAVLGNIFQM